MTIPAWSWESLYLHLSAPWAAIVLALTAVLCGVMIGGERQRREKPAGLRTLTLVCLGSAAFTMGSYAFTTTTGDSGRVAAQIVTGIGFLGAGVILHGQRTISGMTTAAVIWVAAAIGMVVGTGNFLAGLGLSLLVNRMMVVLLLYETRWRSDLQNAAVIVEYLPQSGITRARLERVLVDYEIDGAKTDWVETSSARGKLTLRIKIVRGHLAELLAEIADVPDVCSIAREPCEAGQPSS